MTIYFHTSPAWSFIPPGSPEHEAALTAASLEKDARKPLKAREREQLRRRLTELAQYQDQVGAPDFAVLTSIAPTIRVLAFAAVHLVDDDNSLERIVEDARNEHRSGRLLSAPEISSTRTKLGPGTRVLLRHRPAASGFLRRTPMMLSLRWVLPYQESARDRVCLVTGIVPDEADADIAVPEIDRFVLDISDEPRGGGDEPQSRSGE